MQAVSLGPHLFISHISGDDTAYPGYPYHGTICLENRGDQTSGIQTALLFLKDPLSDTTVTISSLAVDPLRPGENQTIPGVGTLDPQISFGTYYLYGYLPGTGDPGSEMNGTIARHTTPVLVTHKAIPEQDQLNRNIISYIRDKTNAYRVQNGVSPLEWDPHLANISQAYAENASHSRFLSHTDASGNGPAERAELAGYPTKKEIEGGVRIGISENIAYIGTGMVTGIGYVDPTNSSAIGEAFMDGWIKSPGHQRNILDPLSTRFGVGLVWNGEYYYSVSDFW